MKKLIIAAALVAATTAANAAVSLNWGASWIGGHDYEATGASLNANAMAYLVDASIYTTLIDDIKSGSFNTSSDGIMAITGLTNDGDTSLGTNFHVMPVAGTAGEDINALHDSWSSGAATALYTVFVDGDDWVGITQAKIDATVPADKNTLVASFGELTAYEPTNVNYVNWYATAAPIPEPTSGLMLLLGVAGLALRRRRA